MKYGVSASAYLPANSTATAYASLLSAANPDTVLYFDGSTDWTAFLPVDLANYPVTNPSVTYTLWVSAEVATAGAAVFRISTTSVAGAASAASGTVWTTASYGTPTTLSPVTVAAPAGGLYAVSGIITQANSGGFALGRKGQLKVERLPSDGGDSILTQMRLHHVDVSWTD